MVINGCMVLGYTWAGVVAENLAGGRSAGDRRDGKRGGRAVEKNYLIV